MKSLGQRLFARLKSWLSRKKSALPDEIPNAGPVASKSPEQLDPILPTRLSIKDPMRDPEKGSGETSRQVEPEGKEERLVETVNLTPVSRSPQKQLRARKPDPQTEERPVTDAELEELQAENARLKLLLNERLKAKRDGSDNR
ncbi:hypothetical protein [Brucella pseudogrignonensis]|uniref:hypothetical protein n=1 Tax=Brucella pseudogrignonensis TaxID=419475 RepID=UPI0038D1FC87